MTEKKAPRVEDYIDHVLGAIERIETYVRGLDRAAFLESTLVQDAVIRNFQIIGEAANKICGGRCRFRATSSAIAARPRLQNAQRADSWLRFRQPDVGLEYDP